MREKWKLERNTWHQASIPFFFCAIMLCSFLFFRFASLCRHDHSSLTFHASDLPLSFARSSLDKTSLSNFTSFFLYHPILIPPKKTLTPLPNCQNDTIFTVITGLIKNIM